MVAKGGAGSSGFDAAGVGFDQIRWAWPAPAHAQLVPGNLLQADLIDAACEDPEIDRVDYLMSWPWHERWAMVRAPGCSPVAFNRRSPRAAAWAAWRARHAIQARRAARTATPA